MLIINTKFKSSKNPSSTEPFKKGLIFKIVFKAVAMCTYVHEISPLTINQPYRLGLHSLLGNYILVHGMLQNENQCADTDSPFSTFI